MAQRVQIHGMSTWKENSVHWSFWMESCTGEREISLGGISEGNPGMARLDWLRKEEI